MSNLSTLVRAAAYLRMSTDHQNCSIENQLAFIREYAFKNNFEIVRLYADEGLSGVSIAKRSALKNLLEEVKTGECDFSAILVYDVSRWGRFQDSDEFAFYEHICSRAGVRVHYCAEPFQNDGTLSATLMKALKRAMAGEYSRELSMKVFLSQARLAGRGFRQGGTAGYGLRRQSVDENGIGHTVFERGQRKALQTHRLILVPGPPDEIATIHRIYSLFLEKNYGPTRIAEILNREHVPRRSAGKRWAYQAIVEILSNEKYCGCNTYNKYSKKMGARQVMNDRSQWIIAPGAFSPIIEPLLLERAREMLRKRASYTDRELLDYLRQLLRNFGFISTRLIDVYADMGKPCSATYTRRFGRIKNAFDQIGYKQPKRAEILKRVSKLRLQGRAAHRSAILKENMYYSNHGRPKDIKRKSLRDAK